jgi:hypothetical protein
MSSFISSAVVRADWDVQSCVYDPGSGAYGNRGGASSRAPAGSAVVSFPGWPSSSCVAVPLPSAGSRRKLTLPDIFLLVFPFFSFPRCDGNERSSGGCCCWLRSNLRAQLSCARSSLRFRRVRSALRPVYGLYSLSLLTGQLSCWNSCCKPATSRCGTLCYVPVLYGSPLELVSRGYPIRTVL